MNKVEFAIAFERLERAPKQKEVLRKFLTGRTDAEIAEDLGIEPGTVRKQLSSVCKAFGLNDDDERRSRRTDLIAVFSQFKPELLGRLGQAETNTPFLNAEERDNLSTGSQPHIYVERHPAETICYQEILSPHALIRIKGPSQVGKTALLKRTLAYAEEHGLLSVHLNLLLADSSVLKDLDTFLRWLCVHVGRRLKLPNQVEEFWDSSLSSNDNCTAYFDECLLAKIDSPLVLGLDNVDHLFSHPTVAPDFFGLLRAWHEDGKLGSDWGNLRLVVSHSTEAYVSLQIHRSPFNVGVPIELPDFNLEQVCKLVQAYETAWSLEALEQLMPLTGGQPHLMQLILRHSKVHPTFSIEEFLAERPTDSEVFASHLREQWLKLQDEPTLVEAMKRVICSSSAVSLNPTQIHQLERVGLVHVKDGLATPRCELYRAYFSRYLGNK